MIFDYDDLRLVLWAFLIICIICFLLAESITLGSLMILPLISDTKNARQKLISRIAPISLVSLTWLFASITLLFAAWPSVYAVLFSSLHYLFAFMLLFWLSRPVILYFRTTTENSITRQKLDVLLNTGSTVCCLIIGLICGNIIKGIPFHLDSDMRIFFLGDLGELLNPFSILLSGICVSLFVGNAANYLQFKERSIEYISLIYKAGFGFLIMYGVATLWVTHLEGYHINTDIPANMDSNPLNKFVKRAEGLWLDNFEHQPGLWAIPIISFCSCCVSIYFAKLKFNYGAVLANCLTVVFTTLTVAISIFPFLLPSNRSLNSSLTIWDASASLSSLSILACFFGISLPIMLILSRKSAWLCSRTEN